MKSPIHSPACQESPHFCICAAMAPKVSSLTLDQLSAGRIGHITLTEEGKALPGNYIENSRQELLDLSNDTSLSVETRSAYRDASRVVREAIAGAEGNLVAAGGWSEPASTYTPRDPAPDVYDELLNEGWISVPRGGITYDRVPADVEGAKGNLVATEGWPGLVTMDNITVDPEYAKLFNEPGTLIPDAPVPYKVWQSDLAAANAKLEEAKSNAKGWRIFALVLAVTGLASNALGLGRLSGWW